MGGKRAENMAVLSDEKLVSLVKSGNNEGFITLFSRYTGIIESYADRYSPLCVRNELVDAGTAGFSDAIMSYREDNGASFKTFANTCIKAKILDVCKKANNTKRIPKDLLDSLSDIQIADSNDPESLFIKKEYFDMLFDLIKSKLSDLEYTVIRNSAAGMTYKEIAISLGKSEKSVENALLRARKKIKELKGG